jgi:hypothetical protein
MNRYSPLRSRTHHGCPGARALMASASNAWGARASIPATTTAPSSSKKYNSANLVGYTALLRKVGYAARPSSMPSVRKLKTRSQNETRQGGATAPTEFTASGLQSARNFNQLSSSVARPQRIRSFERLAAPLPQIKSFPQVQWQPAGRKRRSARPPMSGMRGADVLQPSFETLGWAYSGGQL